MFPWRGRTVVEWRTGFAGAFCGKILAQAGARVVRFRSDTGLPSRTPGCDGWNRFLDHEKEVRRLRETGHEAAIADILEEADCLIVEDQGQTSADLDSRRESYPGLLTVSISPFGNCGPYSGYRGDELAIGALSGFLDAMPGLPDWRPDGEPPARCLAPLMEFAAGAAAACITQASFLARDRGLRQPGKIEVSKLEVAAWLMISEWGLASYGGIAPGRRRKSRNIEPNCFLPCRNGYVTIIATTDERWRRLVEIMGSPEWALDERLSTADGRAENAELMHHHLALWARDVDGDEFMEAAQARGLPCTAYRTLAEVIKEAHLREVESLEDIGGYILPTDPVRVNGSRRRSIGETRFTASDEAVKRPAMPAASKDAASLSGVTVLDLTQMVAGPMAGQYLAALGADVILIESRRHLVSRAFGPFGGEPRHDASNNFNHVNRGKHSVELDLTTERGRSLFDQLVADADIVLENFSRRASTKLGLSYGRLRSVNRNIVLASISAFGRGGRWGGYVSHHAGVAALSGLTSIVQDEYGRPRVVGAILPDVMTGTYTAGAILQALARRDTAGEGCTIEVSMLDVMLACMGGFIAGDSTEDPAAPMPFAETGAGGGFVAVDGVQPGEIDSLAAAFANKSKLEAMRELQADGRSAGAVLDALEVMSNEHLSATGFVEELEHPAVGRRKLAGVPWLCDGRRPALGVAPCLGSATECIMSRLGLDPAEVDRLREDRVVW